MIASNFPSLKDEADDVEDFLKSVGLASQLFDFVAEALCEVVHKENENADVADLVLGNRNNTAFRTLIINGDDYGLFQHRSKGGKSYITNMKKDLAMMVHNTDRATGLGSHIPKFMSKRSRPGTSYVHSEKQGKLDLGSDVIEIDSELKSSCQNQVKIDVCIFAEKEDGTPICRIELLVDAQLDDRGNEFISCRKRYGMTFKADDFAPYAEDYRSDEDNFEDIVKPRKEQ